MSSAELKEKLGQPLTVGRGAEEDQRKRGGGRHEDEQAPPRKRHSSEGRGGGYKEGGGHQHRQEYRRDRGYQQRGQNNHNGKQRQQQHRQQRSNDQEDNETRFRYRWTVSADQVRILTVTAFHTQLLTVSSNGNIVLDTAGNRSFRVFQALNMCLQPIGLKLIPEDETAPSDHAFKGGNWKVQHIKNKWKLDLEDKMKVSAFPNRDFKKILPNLEALPESVIFSSQPSSI